MLVKISCVGICGTDVKMYGTGKCGLEVPTEPMVMGHEGAGVVAKVFIPYYLNGIVCFIVIQNRLTKQSVM